MAFLQKAAKTATKANIHVVDNLAPVSRIAVVVRSGSRYEPDECPGISHYMKAASHISTENSSVFGIARHMERAGASYKVTVDREFITYRVDCLRDKLDYVMGFIDDTVNRPEYRSWELIDYVQPRLAEDIIRYKKDQHAIANEALHKAAFRGGLAHSTFAPEHQVEKIKRNHLLDFHAKNYTLERMSFFGLGVDAKEFTEIIEGQFNLIGSPYQGASGASRYVGGEARIQAGFPSTLVNFVVPGASAAETKRIAALEVLSSILGAHQQKYVKYGDGSNKSIAKVVGPDFKASMINIIHSDAGLYGFSLQGQGSRLKEITKMAVRHVRKTLGELKEADLKAAKASAKARALISCESGDLVFNNLYRRHAFGVVEENPLEQVDKLTLKDVQDVAGHLLKGKPTLVAVGNPRYAPYVDELD